MTGSDAETPPSPVLPAPTSPVPSGESSLAAVTMILKSTRPWVRLMGIFGYASVAVMIGIGIVAGLAGVATGDVATASLMIVYPLLAVLNIFPAMYLIRYSSRIGDFVASGQQHQLVAALDAQRAFWKYLAILTLVSVFLALAFVGLALMLGIVAGIASTGSGG